MIFGFFFFWKRNKTGKERKPSKGEIFGKNPTRHRLIVKENSGVGLHLRYETRDLGCHPLTPTGYWLEVKSREKH